ncbi:eukaryotic translation initiation factor 3 subunit G-domain-containing protein [Podospora aff. communis PSN243]|uniref:Eukaryotic translation initiation factor 3 subunit G n=1 Tax=Podospora aff. communis PSN243 TaxID=3040156 RepID=A0AAV9GH95_9PEZI|nr:eukaryotic translation initiation factor 3 subunit G-domain-containing protein [Podospora aff. communis PSN243]
MSDTAQVPPGTTLEFLNTHASQSRRARPPHLDPENGYVERVPLRPEAEKLRKRESRLGLRNIFGWNKAASPDKAPGSPTTASRPAADAGSRPGGIRASIAELNWPYSLNNGGAQRSEVTLPSLSVPTTQGLKHKKSASVVRSQTPSGNSRGALATWEPPPLFKAYPQAIKHSHLPACAVSAEAILRLHKSGFAQSSLALDMFEESGAEKNDKAKKKHRRNASNSSLKLEWTTKVFVLVTSGYLLQYTGSGSFDRLPEKILHLGKDSAAFASDVIPGRHWVLQVCSVAEPDRTAAASSSSSLFSRLPFRAQERKQASNLLMVFEGAEDMDSWITTLRREIEALGGRKYLSETGKPKVDDIEVQLKSQTSQRTLVVRDPDRFSHVMSPEMQWDSMMTANPPDIQLDGAETDFRDQSFDDTSTASGISHDGRQLDGLRDSTNRLSFISSGQRTVITSAGSSPACSPIRDSFATTDDGFVPDMYLQDEPPRPRARPNAAAINDRRQSLQTMNHLFEMRPPIHTIPNFSVPQSMGKRYSVGRPVPPEQFHAPAPFPSRISSRRPPPTALAINGRPLSLVEDQPSPLSPPLRPAKTNHGRRRHNWADDVDGEEVTDDLPPPQKITNKDGSTTIIEYHYNDKDQKVKTTRRIRFITHREVVNPRVADRKTWAKFGQSSKDGAGPAADTTTVGENIIFKPSTNWRKDAKDESKDANAQAMKDKLKDKKVKCRICNGEHFTARCPYKDTMAPIGEAAAGGSQADAEDLGARDTGAGAAGAGKKGSYVPPALRSGAGASAGDRMGGSKYGERDDLATLRVTNVSEMAEENELRDMFERFGRVTRVFLAKDRDTGLAKGFAFISFADRTDAVKACAKMDGYGFKHLILRVEFAKKAQ